MSQNDDCVCSQGNYKTIELEFETCECCGQMINGGEPADTPFNLEQLKKYKPTGTCQHCGMQEGTLCINPYSNDLTGSEDWEYICADCLTNMITDI